MIDGVVRAALLACVNLSASLSREQKSMVEHLDALNVVILMNRLRIAATSAGHEVIDATSVLH